jgi:hypothetical protein
VTIPADLPRWLLAHGRVQEAQEILQKIEGDAEPVHVSMPAAHRTIHSGLGDTLRLLIGPYRGRAAVCMCLMTAQALFYNSVFLSLTLVLMRYYGASAAAVGFALLPIAEPAQPEEPCIQLLGGVSGPLLFGHLVGSGARGLLFLGYSIGCVATVVAGVVQWRWGVATERRSLESLRHEQSV